MGLLFELFLHLLVEVFFQVVAEVIGGFLLTTSKILDEFDDPFFTAIVGALLGASVGGLSVWIAPEALVPRYPVPGASLVAGPLLLGWLAHEWGEYRREHEKPRLQIATFQAGAGIAFGASLVRFLVNHWN